MALARLDFYSQTLGMSVGLNVMLPERSLGMERDVGALYMLHGTSDNYTSWQRYSSLERYAAEKNLAIITPDTQLGAYTNQRYGHRYFDYVADEVPEVCRAYFHISGERERNYIGGLSMGGYGALKIGMRRGDQFSRIIALSPGCDRAALIPSGLDQLSGIEQLPPLRGGMSADDYRRAVHFFTSFGSVAEYRASHEDNLFHIARDRAASGARLPDIFMTCGSEDEMVLQPNRDFHALLTELGVSHEYDEAPGRHNWSYWDAHIQRALNWLDA